MTNKEKKVFILAGESSGDYIGSSVMKGLKLIDEKITFFGIGGPLMIEEGLKSKYKMNDFNIIGFLNFLNNYKKLKNYVNEITKLIFFEKPIVVITIDTKGFSYELARNLKKSFIGKSFKCPLIHFVPPTIWAYGKSRGKKWKNLHDGLFCLFKKEEEVFKSLGIKCNYLGNPVIEKFLKLSKSNNELLKKNVKFKDRKRLKCLLLPGSRDTEIKYILPEFISLIKNFDSKLYKIDWVIPTTSLHFKDVTNKLKNLKIKNDIKVVVLQENYDLLNYADIAIACSGTVTLELVLFKIPTIAIYKTDILSATIGRLLVNFKNVILPNFLLGENVVPFLFQEKCKGDDISKLLTKYIDDIEKKQILFNNYSNKIIKLMNYDDISKFNFSKNSSSKIVNIINSYNY
jgi:lipid-A-disaccharide synthase